MGLPNHIIIAQGYVNVLKEVGKNQGWNLKDVQVFLTESGWHKGDSWCAWIWYKILTDSGAKTPLIKNGLARSYWNKSLPENRFTDPKLLEVGDMVIFQKGDTQFGHLACVESINKDGSVTLLEGNTSSGIKGSQANGDGFYRRKRYLSYDKKNDFHVFGFAKVKYE